MDICCECRVLSGRGLCDELIARPEESYRLCSVVVCDLETSGMGAPYIYDISRLRVNEWSSNSFPPYAFMAWTGKKFTLNKKKKQKQLTNLLTNSTEYSTVQYSTVQYSTVQHFLGN